MAKINEQKIYAELDKGTLDEKVEAYKNIKSWLSKLLLEEADRMQDMASNYQTINETL